MTEVTGNDHKINRYNVANVVGYFLNVVITYAIGAAGLVDGLQSNATLSEKYQTLVTPVGWAFAIWGIIFISQLVWVVFQVFWPKQRNNAWVNAIGYNYLWICLAQCGWTLAFSTEQIYLSVAFMVSILAFLVRAVLQLGTVEEALSIKHYMLWKFPFTIHCGWIVAATIVNANVVLVYLDVVASTQFYVAFGCLLALLAVAAFLLVRKRTDFVIPAVLVWALWGVYNELKTPDDRLLGKFSGTQIDQTQGGAFAVLSLIGSGLLVRVGVEIYRKRKNHGSDERSSEEAAYLRAED